jgi:hypothetical protein
MTQKKFIHGERILVFEDNEWEETIYIGENPTGGYICVVPIDIELYGNAWACGTPEYKEYSHAKQIERNVVCGEYLKGAEVTSSKGVERWFDFNRYKVIGIHYCEPKFFAEVLNENHKVVGVTVLNLADVNKSWKFAEENRPQNREITTHTKVKDSVNALSVEDLFQQLRASETNHLGLGDIRLTVEQQDDVIGTIENFERHVKELLSYVAYELQSHPNDSIKDIFNDGFVQCNIPLIMKKDFEINYHDWT